MPKEIAMSPRRTPGLLALAAIGLPAVAGSLTSVPVANPRVPNVPVPTVLSPELAGVVRAQGAMPLENPQPSVRFYGYLDDQPNLVPPAGTASNVEASKTEPDKNTYLVMDGLKGSDPGYDYGRRFLFQGHESGAPGTLTRINLDADAAHRITVLANYDAAGAELPTIDGSTWYPWSARLLLTQEGDGATSGGLWQATPDHPSVVESLVGVLGRGGYEGVQADSDGNLWIAEDIGGASIDGAKLPNSFILRFTPKSRRDLRLGGRLEALQVMSRATPGRPIVYQAVTPLTQDMKDLHTYGMVFDTRWVTVHDTDVDGFGPFNANDLAKARQATPFKRPENGVFRPGSEFGQFFFAETGDTSSTSPANAAHGGYGALMRLTQSSPSAASGRLTMFVKGDLQHTAFDNIAFWDEHRVAVVEDRGDSLHTAGNALDSGWIYDTRVDYSIATNQPVRAIAEGRDVSATIDAALSGTPGFQNDGDNELTGIHVSDGDPRIQGVLGAKIPTPFVAGWRVFYTQQHGENITWEIVPAAGTAPAPRR
jgi:hypothetical protein